MPLSAQAQLQSGDTLYYTTDGSLPSRASSYMTVNSGMLFLDSTTIFRAFLTRSGFADSPVIVDTVFVASGFHEIRFVVFEASADSVLFKQIFERLESLQSEIKTLRYLSTVEHQAIIKILLSGNPLSYTTSKDSIK